MANGLANPSGGVILELIRDLIYLACGYSHSTVQCEHLPPDPEAVG